MTGRQWGTRRDAMLARIIAVARAQVQHGDGVSLRRVAIDLRITPPALYRYVASRDQLLDLVIDAIDCDIEQHVAAAVDAQVRRDATSALVSALRAYRSWALESPAEFRLLLQQHSGRRHPGTGCADHLRSVRYVVDLAARGRVSLAELGDDARAGLHVRLAQVFGVVCLEAFGHVDARVVASGGLFDEATAALDGAERRSVRDHGEREPSDPIF